LPELLSLLQQLHYPTLLRADKGLRELGGLLVPSFQPMVKRGFWKTKLIADPEVSIEPSFKRDCVFTVWFKADLPNAPGFRAGDGTASRFNSADVLTARRPQVELARNARAQRGGDRKPTFPGCVHFDVAASPKSVKAAFRPCRRERRQ
jgi:hypothetical protein